MFHFRKMLVLSLILLGVITNSASFSFLDLFGSTPNQKDAVNNTIAVISELLGPSSSNANIRGGNSKFQYIPEKNHREIFIYKWSDILDLLPKENSSDIISEFTGRIQKRDIFDTVRNIQQMEVESIIKGMYVLCKWAIPIAAYPLSKYDHCSQAELKSVIPN